MCRAYTVEEMRERFMDILRFTARYWADVKEGDRDAYSRIMGFAHSMLCIFDGVSEGMPAIDLILRPHPDDKRFNIDEGDNWIEDGMVINESCHLHDLLYQKTH